MPVCIAWGVILHFQKILDFKISTIIIIMECTFQSLYYYFDFFLKTP